MKGKIKYKYGHKLNFATYGAISLMICYFSSYDLLYYIERWTNIMPDRMNLGFSDFYVTSFTLSHALIFCTKTALYISFGMLLVFFEVLGFRERIKNRLYDVALRLQGVIFIFSIFSLSMILYLACDLSERVLVDPELGNIVHSYFRVSLITYNSINILLFFANALILFLCIFQKNVNANPDGDVLQNRKNA